MQLKLDQHSPIYMQIIDEFKRQVARGDLRPGDRIPSQRELAAMVQVNPNTVQRAYREMELMGITETLRGQGTFITRDPERVAQIRREMADRALAGFVREMHALGYGCEEMVAMVRGAYERIVGETGAGPHAGALAEGHQAGRGGEPHGDRGV
ncbi:MAG TPA: GntR family transcriptional regulator [Limnochordales bacterium]|nr:GntR family transcriptional regulator [Limnochordales bacterium]